MFFCIFTERGHLHHTQSRNVFTIPKESVSPFSMATFSITSPPTPGHPNPSHFPRDLLSLLTSNLPLDLTHMPPSCALNLSTSLVRAFFYYLCYCNSLLPGHTVNLLSPIYCRQNNASDRKQLSVRGCPSLYSG